jgi:4-amino-4-deoxy-L-arabinose transferase-like glycosyltransferase
MTPKVDRTTWYFNAVIGMIAALLFIPFLGSVHLFDWDEINFAESAREMIESGNYLTVQINYIPFWEKPPLFIWMQVISMKLFGVNEFAARFPNAICGIVTLLMLFHIGHRLVNTRFGLIWVFLYAGSILPFLYFKSGIIDPWFNLFVFYGIYQFFLFTNSEKRNVFNLISSSAFIGLAILTKGPVAILVFILTGGIYLILNKFKIRIRLTDILIYSLVLVLIGGFWFILQIVKGNYTIIVDFIEYQIRLFRTKDAGHGGFLFYHFVVLLIGVFPASLLALPSLFGSKGETGIKKEFLQWMLILFWVVLILFTVVKTKIMHYSSLCYMPLTFLATYSVYHLKILLEPWKKITKIFVVLFGFLLAIVIMGITFIDSFKEAVVSKNLIHDPFVVACLSANGEWKGYEAITVLILLVGIILFLIAWNSHKYIKAVVSLTGTIPVFLFFAMLLITPRIERYSQLAAIEFFMSVSNQDAYLATLGYKSYAHLFYGKSKNHNNILAKDSKWLLTGNIDKNAFFAAKINKKDKFMKEYPLLELLYEKNGFVFFKRTPKFYK